MMPRGEPDFCDAPAIFPAENLYHTIAAVGGNGNMFCFGQIEIFITNNTAIFDATDFCSWSICFGIHVYNTIRSFIGFVIRPILSDKWDFFGIII